MTYQPLVKDSLKGRANVFGPMENGRWAGYTLNSLRFWAPFFPDADIVHWNSGLWDLGDDYNLGRHFSLPEEYSSTLERTVRVLRQLYGENVIIIMATITPRKDEDLSELRRYNDILKEVATRFQIEVNDLYAEIIDDIEGNIGPDNIHPSQKGGELLAKKVVQAIKKRL
jgi:hypothetical protein